MSANTGEKIVKLPLFKTADYIENKCDHMAKNGQLLISLHETLDVKKLFKRFTEEVHNRLECGGVVYKNTVDSLYFFDGAEEKNQCGYQLNYHGNNLGEIVFSRKKNFSENEMLEIEYLISGLIQPLRNSLKYHQAVSSTKLDQLTGLRQSAYYFELMPREMQRVRRYRIPYSLMLIDVDDFHDINFSFGRKVGDRLLKEVASRCQQAARDCDLVIRYGCDRFLILLPQTRAHDAKLAAERIKELVAGQCQIEDIYVNFSISIGVVTATEFDDADKLVRRVDYALYHAKTLGKNQIYAATRQDIQRQYSRAMMDMRMSEEA